MNIYLAAKKSLKEILDIKNYIILRNEVELLKLIVLQ